MRPDDRGVDYQQPQDRLWKETLRFIQPPTASQSGTPANN